MNQNNELNAAYWNQRYENNTTGWDMGKVSPPLKEYADTLTDKNLRILIPGCGNTYEADYLLKSGFTAITVIDIAPLLVEKLRAKYAGNKHIKIILGDFFELKGEYDLILEQTFFCALDPSLRKNYKEKIYSLLAPMGKLVGLLFNKEFEEQGPPFGGTKSEYEKLFQDHFQFEKIDPCLNSYPKRAGSELFIILKKIIIVS